MAILKYIKEMQADEQKNQSDSFILSEQSSEDQNDNQNETQIKKELEKVSLSVRTEQNELHVQEVRSIQLMFIIFESYRKELNQICTKYDCELKIGMDLYKIFGKNEKEFETAKKQVNKFLKTIIFFPEPQNQKKKAVRMIKSPYFIKKAEKLSIKLTKFNKQIFFHSTKYTSLDQLNRKVKELSKNGLIFPIMFRRNNKTILEPIYEHIIQFIQKFILFKQEQFIKNKVTVQVNNIGCSVYVIGDLPKNCMFGKNTMRNVLQGLVVLNLRAQLNKKEFSTLKKYCEHISQNFPVYVGSTSSDNYLIISKDSILQKLCLKPKFQQLVKINPLTEAKIFLTHFFNYHVKTQTIRKVCRDHGYNIFFNNHFLSLKKLFYTIDEKEEINPNEIMVVLSLIFEKLSEVKERYDAKSRINYYNEKIIEEDNTVNYVVVEGKIIDQQLTEKLRRDVLRQKIQMKKKQKIQFNKIQEDEIPGIFWEIQLKQNQVIERNQDQLKPGAYFMGSKKISNNVPIYRIQYKITII